MKAKAILLLICIALTQSVTTSAVELKGDNSEEAQAAFKALIERIKKEKGEMSEKWNQTAQPIIDTLKANAKGSVDKMKQSAFEHMVKTQDVFNDTTSADTLATDTVIAPLDDDNQAENAKLKLKTPEFTSANISSMEVLFTDNGQQMEVNASMKMVRDSIIQISLRFLGIEGARIDITPRRVTIYNKIHGRYVEKQMDELRASKKLDIDFYDLQAVLSNQLFILGDNDDSYANVIRKAVLDESKSGCVLTLPENEAGFSHDFVTDKKKHLVETQARHSVAILNCTYDAFKAFKDDVTFPTVINASLKERKNSMTVVINVKRAEFNKPVNINTTNKAKYTRVEHLSDLLK